MSSLIQINQPTQPLKPNIFSWHHIIIAIVISAIVVIIIIILKPTPPPTGGSPGPGPGSGPGPGPGPPCKTYSNCSGIENGYFCDNTHKCSNVSSQYSNPAKIPNASWRGGDAYTLNKIRGGYPFFLRSMRVNGSWGYWYNKDDYSLNNTINSDSRILQSNYIFSFSACPDGSDGKPLFHGFLQTYQDDLNRVIQCSGYKCNFSGKNTASSVCNAGDKSWQVSKFDDAPSNWTIPPGMGIKYGNGITSSALIIKLIYYDTYMAIEDEIVTTMKAVPPSSPTAALFQVAFVNTK